MLIIRKEHCNDYQRIEFITQQAFAETPHHHGKASTVPEQLRKSPSFTFALVAEYKAQTIAHIAISNAQINDQQKNVFSISSLVVLPEFQGKGIGSKLVKVALSKLAKRKAQCCVLVGDPKFYSRLGFNIENRLTYQGAPEAHLQSFYFKKQSTSAK